MWHSYTSTGWRAYLRIVTSRSASTTMVLWIQRVMLVTMQAELVSWRNMQRRNVVRAVGGHDSRAGELDGITSPVRSRHR